MLYSPETQYWRVYDDGGFEEEVSVVSTAAAALLWGMSCNDSVIYDSNQ